MPDAHLGQAEADGLLEMEKRRTNDDASDYPPLGGRLTIPLVSFDRREDFLLDVNRGRISLSKVTYQNRARTVVILARLDLNGATHRNPDGEELGTPHLHLYREGYADKWAFPAPSDLFPNLQDIWESLQDFMRYCHIVEPPHIQKGLFV
jgi:hypothetical protein